MTKTVCRIIVAGGLGILPGLSSLGHGMDEQRDLNATSVAEHANAIVKTKKITREEALGMLSPVDGKLSLDQLPQQNPQKPVENQGSKSEGNDEFPPISPNYETYIKSAHIRKEALEHEKKCYKEAIYSLDRFLTMDPGEITPEQAKVVIDNLKPYHSELFEDRTLTLVEIEDRVDSMFRVKKMRAMSYEQFIAYEQFMPECVGARTPKIMQLEDAQQPLLATLILLSPPPPAMIATISQIPAELLTKHLRNGSALPMPEGPSKKKPASPESPAVFQQAHPALRHKIPQPSQSFPKSRLTLNEEDDCYSFKMTPNCFRIIPEISDLVTLGPVITAPAPISGKELGRGGCPKKPLTMDGKEINLYDENHSTRHFI